jgi:tetratricopeptide (TPR) repeat protein
MSMHRHTLPGAASAVAVGASGSVVSGLTHEQRAAIHYCRGEKDRALELYREAAQLAPEDAGVQKAFADFMYVALGRPEDAFGVYQRVLALKPEDPETLQILGNLCASNKKTKDAQQYFSRLLAIEPWNMAVKKSLDALPPNAAENNDAFKVLYLTAQKSVAEGVEANVNAALDRILAMKQEAARGRDGAERIPTYAEIVTMASNGQRDKAIQALEQFLARAPENALAHNDLGVLYANTGHHDKALAHYRQAVELDPAATIYRKNLADLLFVAAGDEEGALELYVEILRERPRDVETLGSIAQVCASLGRNTEARFFYDKIVEVEPWNQVARQQRSQLELAAPPPATYEQIQQLVGAGKTHEALAALESFVRADPRHAPARNDLGVLYYQSGRIADAQAEYEEAVRLDPENEIFQKNLGEYYSVAQGRYEDALRIFVNLLRKHPRDGETLVSIGKICEMMGRSDDARGFYTKAVEAEPWNQNAREQLQRS